MPMKQGKHLSKLFLLFDVKASQGIPTVSQGVDRMTTLDAFSAKRANSDKNNV